MRPEIEAYLQSNGARYTTKALRQQLIHAGYEAAEVDAALQETEAARAPRFAETRTVRRRFWLWVIGLNAVGLLVATIWAFQGPSRAYAGAVPIVLGLCLLIGLGISGLIGRSMLGRGMGMALLVPLIFTVLLTGTCMAMFGLPTGAI
jgi:cation transport ATPase